VEIWTFGTEAVWVETINTRQEGTEKRGKSVSETKAASAQIGTRTGSCREFRISEGLDAKVRVK
jgi:hypothetical protein